MIVGGMKPSAIMTFLAECEDPLGVINELAYRFHMFHIDFMMKLTDDEVGDWPRFRLRCRRMSLGNV